jgi:hypothetical protein
MTRKFSRKSKDQFSLVTKKPKELVKEPNPQSFGCFTSFSIKLVKFFQNFQKPSTKDPLILNFFKKLKLLLKKEI